MADKCKHPKARMSLVDHGLSVHCGVCREKWSVGGWWLDLVVDPDIDGTLLPAAGSGVTVADLALHTVRLEFALRQMGRAFYRGDHTPKQEQALEFALEAIKEFSDYRPDLKALLDAAIVHFPAAELGA